MKSDSLDQTIRFINDSIYDFFKTNYGTIKSTNQTDSNFHKYKDLTTKQLKKELAQLKHRGAAISDIKYVSRLLRSKLNNIRGAANNYTVTDNYDRHIGRNFWNFVKNVLEKSSSILPSFSRDHCTRFFLHLFRELIPNRTFTRPTWIPSLPDPSIPFSQSPPSYEKVTNVIRRMKSSGSPCPLDKISIICFKRCPYLRSLLTDIIRVVWESGHIPAEWKKACTVLVHKKGSGDEPVNFRPITLESVPLKVFTSCLRDSIFSFLRQNDFIEAEIQKGFTPKIAGVLEHTSMMANIIDKARIKQRSLVITLLDLKNAFGEVHHNLIQEVLAYHHIPAKTKALISSLYTGFHTSIITDDFLTPAIPVRRGVLQGDCLSPLLFNMCFNTFIQFIRQEKYKQLGFSSHDTFDCLFKPVHWFQFADDAAVVTTNERENQFLLNCFTKWCKWSDMVIRVDKCATFGIKKFSSRSLQYEPKLFINSELVPRVKSGESFKYLGRFFNFEMNNEAHKEKLESSLSEMLKRIDALPILPKNKILLYQRYILSKLSWHFTVASLSKTWVIQNLDNVVIRFIRQWLDLPISATLSGIILPQNQFGLNLQLPSIKFFQCQNVLRTSLKSSQNDAIVSLWKNTSSSMNLQYDSYKNTKHVLQVVRQEHKEKLRSQLPSQGFIISFLLDHSLVALNSLWSSTQSKLPKNIFNFTVRYLNNTLASRTNLHKWKLSPSPDCSVCLHPESLLHVISGCKSYLEDGRYTWRHNSALHFVASTLQCIKNSTLYVDLPGFLSPCILTGDLLRPDLLLCIGTDTIYIVELTVGFETNITTNADRKRNKYLQLTRDLSSKYRYTKFINLSMSSIGIFGKSCKSFIEMCNDLGIEKQHLNYILSKITAIIIRSTYYIFCMRNKSWTNPDLLTY